MIDRLVEYQVYLGVIEFLTDIKWSVVCACPPFGTDARFRKCLFPRRELGGSERGPRDEVDVIAFGESVLVLIENKPRLSESLGVLNALGESDDVKLRRIASGATVAELEGLLRRGTGLEIPQMDQIALVLAVREVDAEPPADLSVVKIGIDGVRIIAAPPLDRYWPAG